LAGKSNGSGLAYGGREGDWFGIGVASNKNAISLYMRGL
jgi:hypothetical protein